jgi:hypothetical protein
VLGATPLILCGKFMPLTPLHPVKPIPPDLEMTIFASGLVRLLTDLSHVALWRTRFVASKTESAHGVTCMGDGGGEWFSRFLNVANGLLKYYNYLWFVAYPRVKGCIDLRE